MEGEHAWKTRLLYGTFKTFKEWTPSISSSSNVIWKLVINKHWSAYTHCWRLLVSTRTDVSVRNDHEPYIKFLNQWMFWNFTEMVSKNVKADLFWSSLAFITSHGPVNGLPENEPATYPYINLTYIQLAWHTTKTRGKLLVSGRA